ncbi:MAG: complex I subunit 1 family protein [Bdellovibrionota bacterium]|nr:NADH-quinone oxidoreductase subunit H [Pseudomonadota bacterium]MDY6091150.1 complex I subunit 1 family protein [Bdellovibrionota bacterium]
MDFFLNLLSEIDLKVFQEFFLSSYSWIAYFLLFSFLAFIMISWMSFMAIIGTYAERRIAGFIQCRYGPNRVGYFGFFQPFADGIKLLFKEPIIPKDVNKFLFTLAPIVVFTGALFPFAALPFGEYFKVSSLTLAVLYVLAFESIEVIGIFMAGFASNSKWALFGGMRAVSQILSYEIPLGIAALTVILMSGTMNFQDLTLWQSENGFLSISVFRSPFLFISFIVFFICGLACTKRAPFDLPEAESELTAGFHSEYSSMRFAFFFMAEYAAMYAICAFATVLFLGGLKYPIPEFEVLKNLKLISLSDMFFKSETLKDFILVLFSKNNFLFLLREGIYFSNIIIKSFLLYFIMIWFRWTFPRIRADEFTSLCYKYLVPISLFCFIGVLIQITFFK